MASTTFTGPVTSLNGFIGEVTFTAQSLSGAGAVNVTDGLTSLTTTGASQALTAGSARWPCMASAWALQPRGGMPGWASLMLMSSSLRLAGLAWRGSASMGGALQVRSLALLQLQRWML